MNRKLNSVELEMYMKLAKYGTMQDMYEFAYALGQKHQIQDDMVKIKELQKLVNT
jgi:geranylgeranyl pyrophosphate synthase